jgi:hypothetical protein
LPSGSDLRPAPRDIPRAPVHLDGGGDKSLSPRPGPGTPPR